MPGQERGAAGGRRRRCQVADAAVVVDEDVVVGDPVLAERRLRALELEHRVDEVALLLRGHVLDVLADREPGVGGRRGQQCQGDRQG